MTYTPFVPQYKPFNPPARLSRGGNASAFERKREAPLSGYVKDREAAKGEERFARELYKGINKGLVQDFYFEYSPGVPEGMPGWRQLDYYVFAYGNDKAIAVDGLGFTHKDAAQKDHDKVGDLLILERLHNEGHDVHEIIHIAAERLETQEGAAIVFKELFGL